MAETKIKLTEAINEEIEKKVKEMIEAEKITTITLTKNLKNKLVSFQKTEETIPDTLERILTEYEKFLELKQ